MRAFYDEFKMNYPVALGNEKVAEAYGGVLGLPVTFLIGRDGRVATKYVGEVQMPVLGAGDRHSATGEVRFDAENQIV